MAGYLGHPLRQRVALDMQGCTGPKPKVLPRTITAGEKRKVASIISGTRCDEGYPSRARNQGFCIDEIGQHHHMGDYFGHPLRLGAACQRPENGPARAGSRNSCQEPSWACAPVRGSSQGPKPKILRRLSWAAGRGLRQGYHHHMANHFGHPLRLPGREANDFAPIILGRRGQASAYKALARTPPDFSGRLQLSGQQDLAYWGGWRQGCASRCTGGVRKGSKGPLSIPSTGVKADVFLLFGGSGFGSGFKVPGSGPKCGKS